MMHDRFNTSKHYLSERIFIPEPPQQGQVWTNLNITLLPDYLAYIKQVLSKEEQMLLSDYHLQTYLLETALKPHPTNDFDVCTNQILAHIRSHPQFWVRKKGSEQESLKMHQAIQQYQKDCSAIKECTDGKGAQGQADYRVRTDKRIAEDYTYQGNPFMKGAYRFMANLYPLIIQYVLKQVQQAKQGHRLLIVELLVSLGAHAKLRYKQYQPPASQASHELTNEIEQEIKLFTQYCMGKNVDTKSLSSFKDYFIIANTLIIGKQLVNGSVLQCHPIHNLSHFLPSQLDQLYSDLPNRFISKDELKLLVQALNPIENKKPCRLGRARENYEVRSSNKWEGLYSTDPLMAVDSALSTYQEIVTHPENTNRMKYKLEGSDVGWDQELYLKFLQKFLQFFNVPTNNKKIAMAMGKTIEPNHVKHVKGIYMRNMAIRIENGEVGGGKKGSFQSKLEFLKKDIENFNMKWFKKESKGRVKKLKRRRKRQTFDEEEHDSDY